MAAMEDVLDLYEEPYNPKRPLVGFDEKPCQLLEDVRAPLPARAKEVAEKKEPSKGEGAPVSKQVDDAKRVKRGSVAKQDYEYKRNGTTNVYMHFEPLGGWRHVEVTKRRTKQDFAQQMKYLCDEKFPEAEMIRVLMDNLSGHTKGALYDAFAPEEAHRLARRLEFHYTPKHGSWLNVAECELSVFARQCLGKRRLGSAAKLAKEAKAWEARRNAEGAKADWQFTTTDARIKLKRLYPILEKENG